MKKPSSFQTSEKPPYNHLFIEDRHRGGELTDLLSVFTVFTAKASLNNVKFLESACSGTLIAH